MGYGNARELLTGLGGVAVPGAWKGGLPLDYHVGGTPAVTAHVVVRLESGERAYKWIANTFGTIRGSTWPNEVVIVGGHRDAWGPGTADNIAGTTSVLEAARAWSAAVRAGHRPKRTLVFATWDAEEWGLIGSSEYVESREPALRATTVAYLNQDMNATGRAFGASAAPTLRGVIRRATQLVPAPDSLGSLYDLWRRQNNTATGAEPGMGNLGGGSDFAGFYNHLGIPAVEWGFGGGQGIYHSQYDDILWTSKFGDPGFRVHQANARVGALAMEELADATVLPYDEGALADELTVLATKLRDSAATLGMTAGFDRVLASADQLKRSAEALDAARGAVGTLTPAKAAAVNTLLREAERRLARPAGLSGRPWYRNLLYAADRDNGYADVPLPGISEALRDRNGAGLVNEVDDLATRIDEVRARVDSATALLH
jgi:N-acetylated-alpha-linked acidic dipeptidase